LPRPGMPGDSIRLADFQAFAGRNGMVDIVMLFVSLLRETSALQEKQQPEFAAVLTFMNLQADFP